MVSSYRPETLTERVYDCTKPVTYDEDDEACNIGIEMFANAIGDQCEGAWHRGWSGWNRHAECTIQHLTQKMKKAFSEGDTIKVGVYLMMLNARGVKNFNAVEVQARLSQIGDELERLVNAEEVIAELINDHHRQSVLDSIRESMDDLDKERLRLLKKLG